MFTLPQELLLTEIINNITFTKDKINVIRTCKLFNSLSNKIMFAEQISLNLIKNTKYYDQFINICNAFNYVFPFIFYIFNF